MKPVFRIAFILSLNVMGLESRTFAAFGNYSSSLLGSQASGLGGAATALVGDAAAGSFYNPATLAAMKGNSFSTAVGVYKKFETSYGEANDLIKSALRSNQGFFRALPSSTGSVVRPKKIPFLADYTLALSIVVPEYTYFRGDIKNTAQNVSSLNLVDESLWVGVSIARDISAQDFLGVSLYYTARSMSKLISDRVYNSATDFKIYSEEKTLSNNSIVAILGYLRKLNDFWRIGISVRPPELHYYGRGSYIENTIDQAGFVGTNRNFAGEDSKFRIPGKLAFGVNYTDEDWLFAFDITQHMAAVHFDIEKPEVAETIEHRPLTDVAFGAQYKWRDTFVVRAGLFTNYSSHPEPQVGSVRGQADRVDQYGFAANVDFLSDGIVFTFGGDYSGGVGHSVQRIAGNSERISKAADVFTMLVGTSYSF